MGYRRMRGEDLISMFRRWHAGQSINEIKRQEKTSRNTIKAYIKCFKLQGFVQGVQLPETNELKSILLNLLPNQERAKPTQDVFIPYLDQIREMVETSGEPIKPKTAYLILKQLYELNASYESFKIFYRNNFEQLQSNRSGIIIQTLPGEETQVDYGCVGTIYDPIKKHKRKVYAFCGILSHSRHLFVEFVYSQNTESWGESHVKMGEYFGGYTKYITLDNLKSGVIKPDIHDPKLNKAYEDFSTHYGIFINPCTPYNPQSKGKVERSVPLARELFRKLKTLHSDASINQLNIFSKQECIDVLGQRIHGTTKWKPYPYFISNEIDHLMKLPSQRFEIPVWKAATVNLDQFVSFKSQKYCVPKKYVKNRVMLKKAGKMLQIFDSEHALIREYVITDRSINYYPGDFPEYKQAMLENNYPAYLLRRAACFGSSAFELVKIIMEPTAPLNCRRAQGVLAILDEFKDLSLLNDVCQKAIDHKIYVPKKLRVFFEDEKKQNHFDFILPQSQTGRNMVRDISEYMQ